MTKATAPQSLRAIFAGIIDPRATTYKGVQMRSRLEADFAAHLDRMGVAWEYEPKVYGPSGKGYLPDFRVAGAEVPTFIEVKPTLAEVEGAKRKMAVIWQAHADAVLIVACAEGSTFFTGRYGEPWRSWQEVWRHA